MLLKIAFKNGAAAGFRKFALNPPTQVDAFTQGVEGGKDVPPDPSMMHPGMGGGAPGQPDQGAGGLPPELEHAIMQLIHQYAQSQGGGAPAPEMAPPAPGGEGGIPPELQAMLMGGAGGGAPAGPPGDGPPGPGADGPEAVVEEEAKDDKAPPFAKKKDGDKKDKKDDKKDKEEPKEAAFGAGLRSNRRR